MWSYNYTYQNYLAHYGVLGMKWGVRRRQRIKAKAYAKLINENNRAYDRALMAKNALASNDPVRIKNSVAPQDATNLTSAKKALKKDLNYYTGVTRNTIAKRYKIDQLSIDNMSTKSISSKLTKFLTKLKIIRFRSYSRCDSIVEKYNTPRNHCGVLRLVEQPCLFQASCYECDGQTAYVDTHTKSFLLSRLISLL